MLQMSPSIPPFDEYEARRCCRGPHDALKWMLKMQTAPEDTAAIIIEPILGEGGFVSPPPDFLSTLRKHCDENNIVMIIDEVGLFSVQSWLQLLFDESSIVMMIDSPSWVETACVTNPRLPVYPQEALQ